MGLKNAATVVCVLLVVTGTASAQIEPAPTVSKVMAYAVAILLIALVLTASMISSKRGHRD